MGIGYVLGNLNRWVGDRLRAGITGGFGVLVENLMVGG